MISYIISTRCLLYLQTILHRSDEEIKKQIYMCQHNNRSPGDWCKLVEEDLHQIGIHMSNEHITSLSQYEYKKFIQEKVRHTAFLILKNKKHPHYTGVWLCISVCLNNKIFSSVGWRDPQMIAPEE